MISHDQAEQTQLSLFVNDTSQQEVELSQVLYFSSGKWLRRVQTQNWEIKKHISSPSVTTNSIWLKLAVWDENLYWIFMEKKIIKSEKMNVGWSSSWKITDFYGGSEKVVTEVSATENVRYVELGYPRGIRGMGASYELVVTFIQTKKYDLSGLTRNKSSISIFIITFFI